MPKPIILACCSDTHGELPPSFAGKRFAAFLHGGDVYQGQAPERHVPALRKWLAKQSVPMLAVRGEHDWCDPAGFFLQARDLSGTLYRLADHLWIAGVGWHGHQLVAEPTEGDIKPICRRLRRLIRRQLGPKDRLILLTHFPRPVMDEEYEWEGATYGAYGPGYGAVYTLADCARPIAVIQGHLHDHHGREYWEYRGIGRDGSPGYECLILYPGPEGMLLHVDVEKGIARVEGGSHWGFGMP